MKYLTEKVKNTVLKPYFERQNINPTSEQLENIEFFLKSVAQIESSERLDARNNTSSAKGLYQYVDAAVTTATNRLARYDTLSGEEWVDSLRNGEIGIIDLNKEQQTIVLLGDLMERSGTDARMNKVINGDVQAMKDFYYEEHHTAPDEATRNRVENIFSVKKKDKPTTQKEENTFKKFGESVINKIKSFAEQAQDYGQEFVKENIVKYNQAKDKVNKTIDSIDIQSPDTVSKQDIEKEVLDTAAKYNQTKDKVINTGKRISKDIKKKLNKVEISRLDFLDHLATFVDKVDEIEDVELLNEFKPYQELSKQLLTNEIENIEKTLTAETGYDDNEYSSLDNIKQGIREDFPDMDEEDVEAYAKQEYNFYNLGIKDINETEFNNSISNALQNNFPQQPFNVRPNTVAKTDLDILSEKVSQLVNSEEFLSNPYVLKAKQQEIELKRKANQQNVITKDYNWAESTWEHAKNSLVPNIAKEIIFDIQESGMKEDEQWIQDTADLGLIELREKYGFLKHATDDEIEAVRDTPNIDAAHNRITYEETLRKRMNEISAGEGDFYNITSSVAGGLVGDAPLLGVYSAVGKGFNALRKVNGLNNKYTSYAGLNFLAPTNTVKRFTNSAIRSTAIETPIYNSLYKQFSPNAETNIIEDFFLNSVFDLGASFGAAPKQFNTITGKTEKDFIKSKINKEKTKAENYTENQELFDNIETNEQYSDNTTIQEKRKMLDSMNSEVNAVEGNSIVVNKELNEVVDRNSPLLEKETKEISEEEFETLANDVKDLESEIKAREIDEEQYTNIDIKDIYEEKNLLLESLDNNYKTAKSKYEKANDFDFKQTHEDINRLKELNGIIDNYLLVNTKNDLRKVLDYDTRGKKVESTTKKMSDLQDNVYNKIPNTAYTNKNFNPEIPVIEEIRGVEDGLNTLYNQSTQKVRENIKDIDYEASIRDTQESKTTQQQKQIFSQAENNLYKGIENNRQKANQLENNFNNDKIIYSKRQKELENTLKEKQKIMNEIRKKYGC